MIQPCYSIGGTSLNPNFPVVSGTVQGSGNPIEITGAVVPPVMVIVCAGGTATVYLEANGGQLVSTTGKPPAGEWVDVSAGGYAMLSGATLGKLLPQQMPYYRCRISAIAGATVTCYVPLIVVPGGSIASAGYPTAVSIQSLF